MQTDYHMRWIGACQTIEYYANESKYSLYPGAVAMDIPELAQISSDQYVQGDLHKEVICVDTLKAIRNQCSALNNIHVLADCEDWRFAVSVEKDGSADEVDVLSIALGIYDRCNYRRLYTHAGKLRYSFYSVVGTVLLIIRNDIMARMVRDETIA